MKKITACTMDCPDACSLIVYTDNDGSLHIKGNPDHPVTSAFVCSKIKNHIKRLQSSERIVHPMVRKGTKWQPVNWDTALNLCAEKIQKFRTEPASILHLHGEGAKGVLKQVNKLFFRKLGTSQAKGSLCDAAGYLAYIADFGSRENNDIKNLLKADKIINWGKDLSRSSIHTAEIIRRARRQGTKILSISPGGDNNPSFSDAFIRIRPGTDRFLAAAAIRLFIERDKILENILIHTRNYTDFRKLIVQQPLNRLTVACDISLNDVEKIYEFYAAEGPSATLIGAGVQRYLYGGENVRFINALALISGNIGCSGGGSYFHHHSLKSLNLEWTKDPRNIQRRTLRLPRIGDDILEAKNPSIKMIWVNGSNIINQAPDSHKIIQAFESVEFKVVVDAFMNDTAARADLFLPCALMLEQEDIISSYLHNYIHYADAVLAPLGEAKSDFWIFHQLSKRLQPPVSLPDAETCLNQSLYSNDLRISLEALREQKFVKAKRPEVVYTGMQFDHRDKKYHFPLKLHQEPLPPPEYPLRLLTLIRRNAIHSQIQFQDQTQSPVLFIAPNSAGLMNLDLRKDVYLVSDLARLKVKVQILHGLHPDAVIYRRGDWIKYGGGANQLIAPMITDLGKGAAFYSQYVRLENA
ncbi:MAG: molybdopterin-dependent oxidoreductase [Desulfobacterales bacterium]|nr:molybdopterin-dependent oxidoreductase [Desulfobacterales bacterium]